MISCQVHQCGVDDKELELIANGFAYVLITYIYVRTYISGAPYFDSFARFVALCLAMADVSRRYCECIYSWI